MIKCFITGLSKVVERTFTKKARKLAMCTLNIDSFHYLCVCVCVRKKEKKIIPSVSTI